MRARFVVNVAGLFADKVAEMVGDRSFKILPRIGEYLLLHKDQVSSQNVVSARVALTRVASRAA